MPLKTFPELKTYFPAGARPSMLSWNNFFDTLALIEQQAIAAYEINGPVLIVADQAARLAIGGAAGIGRQVKQTDNGITYVKQQAPGTNNGDWVAIGDTDIQISDVATLQTELNNRLNRAGSDSTLFTLAAKALKSNQATQTAPITDLGATERIDLNFDTGSAYRYTASVTKDFSIGVQTSGSPLPSLGMTQTVFIKNNTAGPLSFTTPADIPDAGSGASFFVLANGVSPLVLNAGKTLTLAVLKVPIDPADPDYPAASPPSLPGGGYYYFITAGMQA